MITLEALEDNFDELPQFNQLIFITKWLLQNGFDFQVDGNSIDENLSITIFVNTETIQ